MKDLLQLYGYNLHFRRLLGPGVLLLALPDETTEEATCPKPASEGKYVHIKALHRRCK